MDVTASETMAAIHDLSGGSLPTVHGLIAEHLTLSHFTGDDRVLTTTIADLLRASVTLDDGSEPFGIEFISEHGYPAGESGKCWAYWMRAVDARLTEPTRITATATITESDVAYAAALELCKITSR